MSRTLILSAALGAALAAGGATAEAMPRLDLIVDRDDVSVSVFLTVRLDALESALGVSPDLLRAADGMFPIAVFQQTGTADLAETIAAGIGYDIGGAEAEFPAMSMMVHPEERRLPFVSPIDGWIAISVCGTEGAEGLIADRDVRLYAGYTAYPVDGTASLEIVLPNAEPLAVTLRDHRMGEPLEVREMVVDAAQPLALPGGVRAASVGAGLGNAARWGGILTLLALSVGLLAGAAGARRRRRAA